MRFDFGENISIEIEDRFLTGPRLNLGCGNRALPGFVNLDFMYSEGVDIVHDLESEDLPFDDDTFDFIFIKSILDQMPHRVQGIQGEFMFHLINDLIRVSKNGAVWDCRHPCNPLALQATDHVRIIARATFDPWTKDLSVLGSLEATTLATSGRLKFIKQTNVRKWALDSSFGRAGFHHLIYQVHKMGE